MKKADYELLAAFRRELRQFLTFSEKVARETGLPAQQYQALLAIKGRQGEEQMTVGELAQELHVSRHSASQLVDRLVGKQFLIRDIDNRDRRRTFLALTSDAEALLGRMALTHLEELRRMQPSLAALVGRFGPTKPR